MKGWTNLALQAQYTAHQHPSSSSTVVSRPQNHERLHVCALGISLASWSSSGLCSARTLQVHAVP
eukprot:3276705-Pleurochrysis_carterae.AAC.3